MTEAHLVILLVLALIGQSALFYLHVQTLTNKIMSRDFPEYQAVRNSARMEPVTQPHQPEFETPEDLRGLAGIG